MQIRTAASSDLPAIIALWNEACEVDLSHKPLSQEGFKNKFLSCPDYPDGYMIVAEEGNELIGFTIGIVPDNAPHAFISMCIVKREHRRGGIGRVLLTELERRFKAAGKRAVLISCQNPVRLDWFIPDTPKHDHNNVPGVDICGTGYPFLKACGYAHTGTEFSYYRPLEGFERSESSIERERMLAESNVLIEIYDPKKHHSLDELFDDLGVGAFRNDAMPKLALDPPWPLIIASQAGCVVGFTGPVGVQESGRGWFAGIGVHSRCRGMGIMTVLFDRLLVEFKAAGASFSSLFTGENNPARKTYEHCGFRVAKRWAIMRKEL